MNGFDNRPNPELMRERMEKLRRVKLDLRGVGWTMLASELIHTWLSVFIMGVLVAQRIARDFSAAACDMEGGAIAQVAMTAGVPYAAYRAISDTLTGNGQEYARNADRAAAVSGRLLSAFLNGLKEDLYEL